jgi:hypothetical protein
MPKNKTLFLSLLFVLISFLYFTSRYSNLSSLPVFADEAIYVRWSQVIKNVETLRFIPLNDGKQPLFMWITVPFLSLFSDPLVAGRSVSIFSGFITMITLVLTFSLILHHFSSPKLDSNPFVYVLKSLLAAFPFNFIPALIYLSLPFSFFFDRLSTADNLLSAFGLIIFFLTLLQSIYHRFDLSLLLGLFFGLAWMTKSPAIYFIVLSFATIVITSLISNPKKLLVSLLYQFISTFIGFAIYNTLRLGPQFHMIALRNLDYVWPISEILKHPLDPLKPHLSDTISIFKYYIGLPLLIFTLIASMTHFKNIKKVIIFTLLCWWLLPLIANAAFAKVFTTRYILFILPFLVLFISLFINQFIRHHLLLKIAFLLILFFTSTKIFSIANQPFDLQLPSVDRGYVSGWTSGWGIRQSADYLVDRSKVANVIVGTEGYFGTLPDGLQIYTDSRPQLTIIGSGIDITEIPSNLVNAKNSGDEVYLLFNQSRLKLPPHILSTLSIIKSYNKPDNDQLLLIKI